MRNRKFVLVLIVLIMLASVSGVRADVTGSILGVVHDRSGGAVAGAQVVATNVATNLKQETESASDGSFRILALPAGTLRVMNARFVICGAATSLGHGRGQCPTPTRAVPAGSTAAGAARSLDELFGPATALRICLKSMED